MTHEPKAIARLEARISHLLAELSDYAWMLKRAEECLTKANERAEAAEAKLAQAREAIETAIWDYNGPDDFPPHWVCVLSDTLALIDQPDFPPPNKEMRKMRERYVAIRKTQEIAPEVTVQEAARVLLGDDIALSKMGEAMHNGPLGADDEWFSASTKAGGWCLDCIRAALAETEGE